MHLVYYCFVQITNYNQHLLCVYLQIYMVSSTAQTYGQEYNFYPLSHMGAEEGLKDMQMGGTTPRMDRRAEGMLQIPSPQISPDATATA